jgi:malate permease and related proteins
VTGLFGLEGAARAALIQQSAMPVAVFNYLFALRWNNQPEEIAGIVVVSTLAAIVTTPILLYVLLA